MGGSASAGLNTALEKASDDELKNVAESLTEEQRKKVTDALESTKNRAKFQVTENAFTYFKTSCPISFAEGRNRCDWYADPLGAWTFEPEKDKRPDGPQIGDRRFIDKDIVGFGHVKGDEELIAYNADDNVCSVSYHLLESSHIKVKNYKGTISVYKDPDNAEKCFGEYKATWESGDFDEMQTAVIVGGVETVLMLT